MLQLIFIRRGFKFRCGNFRDLRLFQKEVNGLPDKHRIADRLDLALDGFGAGHAVAVPLLEVKL